MFHHHRNRILPATGAYSAAIIWYRVVVQTGAYADALEPVGTTTRCQLSSTRLVQGQRYQLLLQPVPMGAIGTGCNSSWYLWAGPMAHFLLVRNPRLLDQCPSPCDLRAVTCDHPRFRPIPHPAQPPSTALSCSMEE